MTTTKELKRNIRIQWNILVVMIMFLLTTFNLHNYPQNPSSVWEWFLMLVGIIIWFSPFIVMRLNWK